MALYQAFPRNGVEYPQNGEREIIIEMGIPSGIASSSTTRRVTSSSTTTGRGSIVGLVTDRIPLKMPGNG